MPNRLSYPKRNVQTENGGEILWSEGVFLSKDGGLMVGFWCAAKRILSDGCPGKGEAQARRVLKLGRSFRALHADCYRRIRGMANCESVVKVYRPRRTDELLLPKGTKVLYHTRRPENSHLVGIECRGCFKDTGKIKYIQDSTINHYVNGRQNWDELCSDCVRARGSLSKLKEDRVSKKSETVILFRSCRAQVEVNGEAVEMVGGVASTCKCLWFTTEVNAVNNWDTYLEVCPDCQRPGVLPKRLRFLGLLDAHILPQNGNGRVNGSDVDGRRRKRDPLKAVNGKSLEDLNASILKHYDSLLVNSRVTLELVAQDLGLGRAGIGDGGQKNVSRLLRRNDVADSFPVYRDRLITSQRANPVP
jgi:hypothetical protein